MTGGVAGVRTRRRRAALPFALLALVVVLTLLLGVLVACNSSEAPARPFVPQTDRVAGAEPAKIAVDLARSKGKFPFKPGGELSVTPKTWRYGPTTLKELKRLELTQTRVWLSFAELYDVDTRLPHYDRAYDYLDTHSALSKTLIVVWQTNYDPLVTGGGFTAADLGAAQRDMLAHLKKRYPKIEYIEVENEPADIAAYYPKYRMMYQAVNAVSELKLPGAKLKVGGPTLDTFSDRRLGQFFDLYKADTDHGKRLDFVSYHQYLITTEGHWHDDKDNPAIVASERSRLDRMLSARGLVSRPVLITESGMFPAMRGSSPDLGLDTDLHIQAAGMASMHYFYLNQRGITPLHWTVDHPENDRKDLFFDTASGLPRPYYNALRMQSMLPETRFEASSDRLSKEGIGVYALAAATDKKVAVMSWNYQWTQQMSYNSELTLGHLPKAFRTGNVLVERYKIGKDLHFGEMTKLKSYVITRRADGTFTPPTTALRPNELQLLVLSATADPVGPRGR